MASFLGPERYVARHRAYQPQAPTPPPRTVSSDPQNSHPLRSRSRHSSETAPKSTSQKNAGQQKKIRKNRVQGAQSAEALARTQTSEKRAHTAELLALVRPSCN